VAEAGRKGGGAGPWGGAPGAGGEDSSQGAVWAKSQDAHQRSAGYGVLGWGPDHRAQGVIDAMRFSAMAHTH